MSNYIRVSWHPTERVARAAQHLDNHFSPHQYGVRFEGDDHVYRPHEVEIPLDLVLVPENRFNPNWTLPLVDHLAGRLSIALHKYIPHWPGATDEELAAVAEYLVPKEQA